MSEYLEIAKRPTVLESSYLRERLADYGRTPIPTGFHESTLRAYSILEKVKELLRQKVPAQMILDLIEIMESKVESS